MKTEKRKTDCSSRDDFLKKNDPAYHSLMTEDAAVVTESLNYNDGIAAGLTEGVGIEQRKQRYQDLQLDCDLIQVEEFRERQQKISGPDPEKSVKGTELKPEDADVNTDLNICEKIVAWLLMIPAVISTILALLIISTFFIAMLPIIIIAITVDEITTKIRTHRIKTAQVDSTYATVKSNDGSEADKAGGILEVEYGDTPEVEKQKEGE